MPQPSTLVRFRAVCEHLLERRRLSQGWRRFLAHNAGLGVQVLDGTYQAAQGHTLAAAVAGVAGTAILGVETYYGNRTVREQAVRAEQELLQELRWAWWAALPAAMTGPESSGGEPLSAQAARPERLPQAGRPPQLADDARLDEAAVPLAQRVERRLA